MFRERCPVGMDCELLHLDLGETHGKDTG
jgi:hypothetical protein